MGSLIQLAKQVKDKYGKCFLNSCCLEEDLLRYFNSTGKSKFLDVIKVMKSSKRKRVTGTLLSKLNNSCSYCGLGLYLLSKGITPDTELAYEKLRDLFNDDIAEIFYSCHDKIPPYIPFKETAQLMETILNSSELEIKELCALVAGDTL